MSAVQVTLPDALVQSLQKNPVLELSAVARPSSRSRSRSRSGSRSTSRSSSTPYPKRSRSRSKAPSPAPKRSESRSPSPARHSRNRSGSAEPAARPRSRQPSGSKSRARSVIVLSGDERSPPRRSKSRSKSRPRSRSRTPARRSRGRSGPAQEPAPRPRSRSGSSRSAGPAQPAQPQSNLEPGNFGPYGHGKSGADKFVKDMMYLFEDKGINGAVLRYGANNPTKAKWESTVAAVAASNNPAAFLKKIFNLYKGEHVKAAADFGMCSSSDYTSSTIAAADLFLQTHGTRDVLARVDFKGLPKKKSLEKAVLIRAGLWQQPTASQVQMANDIIETFLKLGIFPEYSTVGSARGRMH